MRELRAARAGQKALTEATTAAPQHEGFCLKCGEKKTVYTEQVKASAVKGVQHHRGACGTCGATVTTFKSTKKDAK
jgi:hypothetical protein